MTTEQAPEGLNQFRWIQIGILGLGVGLYLITLMANMFVPTPTATQARSLKLGESLSAGAFMAAVAGLTSQFGASATNLQASGVMVVGGLGAFALVYGDFRPFSRGGLGAKGADSAAATAGTLAAVPVRVWPNDAIFISYRRAEWEIAGRIRDGLNGAFGEACVYFDQDDTNERWKAHITAALARAQVLIAVIGPKWESLLIERAAPAEADTALAVDAPVDEVFEEINAALMRGITVIPVIVGDDTPLPNKRQLQQKMRADGAATQPDERLLTFYDQLSAWQYRTLQRATWDYEFSVIVKDITRALEKAEKDAPPAANT